MAEQRVVLDFFVNGTSRIDKLVNQVTQLQGVVDSLNQVPLEINVKKATSQFERLDSELKLLESTLKGQKASFSAANKSINDQQKAIDKSGTSIEKYQDQLVSIQRQLQSLNPGTKKYNDLLDRQNKIIKDYASAQSDLAEAQDKILESQKNKNIIGERLEKTKIKLKSGQDLQSEAKRFKQLTEALDGLASQYLELGIAQKKAKETTPLASGLDIRAARPRTQENPSIAQLNSQASALDLIAKNSSVASSQFNRFTIATEVASQRIYEAGQQKLKALAFGLSKQAESVNIGVGGPKTIAAARDTIDSLIGSYGGVAKSEAALSSYISRLQSLQSLVPYLSEEYNKLERAIGDVSAEMESLQKMTQLRGAVSKIQPQAGPASLLPSESVKSADEKAKYYEKINKYQDRLVGVEERISQANLNTLQQTELRARVDKALGLLAENRLDDAKKETIEIERQRMSLERMNRAQKPLTFGALGTGFSPISGELPGGVTIAGSPAAKIAEAKANRESTQAAVALAQQKQKAVEQEAEELRKGTQAATALGKQKLKALEDQANLLREETRNAVALAQQKMREEEKAIADAWKMRGGPELPPGFTEAGRIQQRGGVYRTGEFSPVGGKKRLENIKASGAILEQSLINLERKGIDVTTEREKLQKALNAAKEDGFDISLKTLDALDDQLTSARNFIRLQNTIRAGEAKGSKAAGSGLEAALKSLQEARGARQAFLGGASPAEAIDKIVREFNTGKISIGNAGQNAVTTFISNIKGAAGGAASAGKSFADAAAKAILKVFGIASPSRFMIELVKNLADTYISQMQKEYPRIKAATARAFGEETLLRDVTKLRATNRGFEEYGRPSTGFRPFPAGAGTPGATSEFNNLISSFRKQIAELTTQPGIYGNMLNALPNSRITTDLIGVANRRAAASEIPSFMSTQRMLGPGELEKFITAELAKYLRDIKIPNPWVGAIGDYKEFIAKVISETDKLRISPPGIRSLPQGQIAGLLPAGSDVIGSKLEDRIRQAFERSAQRSAAVFAEDATRRLNTGLLGLGGGGAIPPGGGGGGTAGVPGAGGGNQPVNLAAELLGLEALGDISRISTRELEALSAVISELRSVLDPTIKGFDRLDNQLRETIGDINRQLERRDPNADFLTRRVGPRTGRAVSEGLVGGAFPLLFGQGAGASLGGLLGGAAGGFAGGSLGFGLSLAGTALGTTFDTFVQSAKDLASALERPVENFNELKTAAFFSSKELERGIQRLIDFGDIASASAAIQEEAIKKIGVNGVKNLAYLGSEADRLNRAWSELGQQMQALIAGPLASFISAINQVVGPMVQTGRVEALRGSLSGAQQKEFDAELNRAATRGTYRPTGRMTTPAIEALVRFEPEKVQAILDKWQPMVIKGKVKITEKERIESEINGLQKQIEAIDLAKGITGQVRQAAREQEDLDRQRADLIRSYEESVASLRERVEDEIARKRFAVIEQENRLLDIRESNQLRVLQASNRQAIFEAGRPTNGRPEFAEAAQEAASIVAQFTEEQLTAEQEAAKIKRSAALDAKKLDFESAQFKANIEKELSRLNIETARKVADINLQVRRKNEEYDANRFNLEKEIGIRRLEVLGYEVALLNRYAEAYGNTVIEKSTFDLFNKIIKTAMPQLQQMTAPAPLREIGAVGGGGVSTKGLDQLVAGEKDVIRQQTEALLEGIAFDSQESIDKFDSRIQELVASYQAPLTKKTQEIIDERQEELEYIARISRGITGIAGEKQKEIIAEGKLLKLRLEGIKAGLEAQKYTTDKEGNKILQAPAVIQAIDAQIQKVQADLLALPDLIDAQIKDATALVAPIPGLRVAQRLDEVKTSLQELATWESVGITAAEAVGDAFGQAFKDITAGTASAQEILAGFFQNLANAFSDMASQMISQMIQMLLFNKLLNILSPGANVASATTGFADGGMFPEGIKPFAMGGVVSSPTLFKFANGGAMNTGVMGEAGPEAILPLSRGSDGKLGVSASGSNGGSTNVTVNVDASGSKVQGDNASANQLGKAVAAAVQEELIRQKRPGGLLR